MSSGRVDGLGLVGSPAFVAAVGWTVVAAGVGTCAFMIAGASPAERGVERVTGPVAFAAIIAAPGVMALLSLRGRPAMILPAATILVLASFLSFAGVLLPLLIPAACLFTAYGRRSARVPTRRGAAFVTTAFALGVMLVALWSLFSANNPRTYTTGTGSYGTSNVATLVEGLTSLAFSTLSVMGAWTLAAPARYTGTDSSAV